MELMKSKEPNTFAIKGNTSENQIISTTLPIKEWDDVNQIWIVPMKFLPIARHLTGANTDPLLMTEYEQFRQ
jgi:hypothetical protein